MPKKTKKQKLSACCNGRMIGGVQCEICGSNGKLTTGSIVVKKLDRIISLISPAEKIAIKEEKTKNEERFIDNKDGTILDMETGLMWQKEGSPKELNFKDAEKYCKDSAVAGFNDWRLPTVKELISIIDYERSDPAINPIFGCKSSWYWSGSPVAGVSDGAWYVSFYYGYVGWGHRSGNDYVRPVRLYLN